MFMAQSQNYYMLNHFFSLISVYGQTTKHSGLVSNIFYFTNGITKDPKRNVISTSASILACFLRGQSGHKSLEKVFTLNLRT